MYLDCELEWVFIEGGVYEIIGKDTSRQIFLAMACIFQIHLAI